MFDLYGFTFKELKIPYKIVVGMSRFLGNISASKYILPLSHEFMYYIPETEKFISPYEEYLSYGNPMYEVQGSNGILYDPSQTFVLENYMFPIAPPDYTVIETENKVVLSEDLSSASIEKIFKTKGYEGQLVRKTTSYLKQNEEEKELIDFIKNRTLKDLDTKILKYTFENQEFNNNHTNTPFIMNLNVELNESIAENAGDLLIVNIGKVIGKQNDLYQENDRKFDIELPYAKTYKHKIIFTIPTGYEIENYNDLIIDRKMSDKTEYQCSFQSKVKTEGSDVIIEIIEEYNHITYPLASYAEYRNIVNAASDFTKANIVLKHKK